MAEDAVAPDILLITLGFPPARGGIQSCLYERASLAAGRIVVLAPAHPAAAAFDARQPFPIQRWPAFLGDIPLLKRLAQFLFSLLLAWRLCRRYPIRCIECGQALPFGAVAWLLQKTRAVPYRIWTYGDDILKPARGFPLRWLLLGCLRPAQRLIAVSEFGRRLLLDLGLSAQRIEVIYPIVPLGDADCHARRNEASDTTPGAGPRPTLLTVARLVPRKGVHVLIRLLPPLVRQYPRLLLQIAGDGPERAALVALTRQLGMQEHVEFLGDVSPECLAGCYAGCDLFVLLPTPDDAGGEAEGFGMVYLEAAAAGRPSVAWRTGGVEEAVLDGRTGLLVARGDVEAARWAIAGLLADPAWMRDLGCQARAWAEELVARSRRQLLSLDGMA